MSDDNLILFPKKSNNSISMSDAEAKWMISGTLLVVLTVAIGINASLFSPRSAQDIAANNGQTQTFGNRSIASTQPLFRVSWEKKAFEILDKAGARDIASAGEKPSVFDKFAIGTLEGHYSIRKIDGKISEIQLSDSEESRPKSLINREEFLQKNLALFSDSAKQVKPIHVEDNAERVIERFQLKGDQGQDLGVVQILLDKDQNLLSMTVQ